MFVCVYFNETKRCVAPNLREGKYSLRRQNDVVLKRPRGCLLLFFYAYMYILYFFSFFPRELWATIFLSSQVRSKVVVRVLLFIS